MIWLRCHQLKKRASAYRGAPPPFLDLPTTLLSMYNQKSGQAPETYDQKSLDSVLDKSIILTITAPNGNAKSISVQCAPFDFHTFLRPCCPCTTRSPVKHQKRMIRSCGANGNNVQQLKTEQFSQKVGYDVPKLWNILTYSSYTSPLCTTT